LTPVTSPSSPVTWRSLEGRPDRAPSRTGRSPPDARRRVGPWPR
jgi:hypothetical protein